MSIYASLPAPNDGHSDDCSKWVETDPDCFELIGKRCSCKLRDAPLVYQGSHVLPSLTDEREGYVDLALIPGHITRDGRDDRPELETTPYPFLRFGVNDATVVLDRAGVERVHRTLGEWLERLS